MAIPPKSWHFNKNSLKWPAMKGDKVETFMQLAGQTLPTDIDSGSEATRKLGAQLLLSEVLEYVIKGLGVIPEIHGKPLTDPEAVHYTHGKTPQPVEMLDGLADVAYTMYWNALAFGMPLEEGYDLVCDNNLEKFVRLDDECAVGVLPALEWHCGRDIRWPAEVTTVQVVDVKGARYAVGKDARGKVRKPSSYSPVDLSELVNISVRKIANG